MSIAQALVPEWDQEVATTKKMLALVPEGKADWKPHPKSMSLGRLASHLAEIPTWAAATMNDTALDLNPPGKPGYKPVPFETTAANLAMFEANAAAARTAMGSGSDEDYMVGWSLQSGGQTFFTLPRVVVMRSFVISHMIHHRAQLGVFLRLLDVPIPGTYGPSADEPM